MNPYLVLQEEGYSKHYFIEGQRIASFVGEEWEEHFSRSTGLRKAGDDQVNYPAKTERLLDGMERHCDIKNKNSSTIDKK